MERRSQPRPYLPRFFQVAILQKCEHAHLLPLLGYCLRKEAPCLVFELMRGGSLQ